MKYILEIYYQGNCLERREQDDPLPNPIPGDQLSILFSNSKHSEEYGVWWTVRSRTHVLFNMDVYTLRLHCEPDQSQNVDADASWLRPLL